MFEMDADSRGLVTTAEAECSHYDENERSLHDENRLPHPLPVTSSYLRSQDFVELLCCVVFGLVCAVVEFLDSTSVRKRPIPYQILDNSGDVAYNLSFKEELSDDTVSDAVLMVVAVVLPVLLQFALTKTRGKLGESHATVCVYFVAVGLTTLVTALIKNYVGYLRPVFYDLCEPNDDLDACTGDQEREARRSFPSGHASTSFCGLILLTLYLLDHFGVASCVSAVLLHENGGDRTVAYQYRRPSRIKRLVSIVCLIPMGVATFISASRVVDNRHFPADVVTGALIGSSIGWFSHRLWFLPPPLALAQLSV